MNGLLITLEGCDGLGKSRQATLLVEELRRRGDTIHFTKEPGTEVLGSPLGPAIRKVLFEKSLAIATGTDQLYLLLDHVDNIALTQPHLDAGEVVICDRYSDSAFAYAAVHPQPTTSALLELWKRYRGPVPDLTILLVAKGLGTFDDIGWALDRARARTGIEAVKQAGKAWNSYEAQLLIQRSYLTLLANEDRTVIVPIAENDSEQVVHRRVISIVERRLENRLGYSSSRQLSQQTSR